MSNTPRTDEATKYYLGTNGVMISIDFARQLERELNAANSGNWYGAGISIATELALAGRKPEDIVDAVKGLVRELNESHKREAQLRAALEEISKDTKTVYGRGPDSDFSSKVKTASALLALKAISAPPPPVVPVEDVKPLVEALQSLHDLGSFEMQLISAILRCVLHLKPSQPSLPNTNYETKHLCTHPTYEQCAL